MKFGAILTIFCACFFHVQSAEINIGNFDLSDLINVPTSNKEAFADVFKQKYGDKIFKIFGPVHENDSKITEFSDSIVISDLQTAQNVVKKFGSLITKVEVNFEHFNSEGHQEILKQVNALESLVDLYLSKCQGNLLKKLSKSFANVKKLRLQGELKTLKTEAMQFNQLFPALEELDCAYLHIQDGKSIEQRMPHLKYLNVKFLETSFSEANIENLLKMNPQTTTLNSGYSSANFIEKVSEYLPNIEKISFELVSSNVKNDSGPEANLKNVKEARISSKSSNSIDKLTFEKLEVLEIGIFGAFGSAQSMGLSNNWIQFITKNKQLNTLQIPSGVVDDEQLSKLNGMEHLTAITIGLDKNISVEIVMEFLKSNPKLKTAYFKNLERPTQELLRVKLSDEWKSYLFNYRGGNDVYFGRKN